MTITSGARHRAERRPTTVFSSIGQHVTGHHVRRGMLAAASSGLAISMAASTATAAPEPAASKVDTAKVDVAALTAEARGVLTTTPALKVSADATWESGDDAAAEATPAPEPEPVAAPASESAAEPAAAAEPAPAAERTAAAASRSSTRTEAPSSSAEASAPETSVKSQAPASAANGSIVSIAMQYVGTPYVWGGSTPGGFDCSGFTAYVYAQAGITIPRSSSAQRNAGTQVSASAAQPGDLVWWPGHVGIYVGDGQYIAAHSPGNPLSVRDIHRSNPTYIRVS